MKGRGDFNRLYATATTLEVSGWILDPRREAETIRVSVNGTVVEEAPPGTREDVGAAFPWAPHARRSGFAFSLPRPAGRTPVVVEALRGRRVLVRAGTTFAPELEGTPVPDADLLLRILPGPDPFLYKASGLYSYTCFLEALAGRLDLSACPRMLDWGCGSGRLSALFLATRPGPEVFGCDIDGEAAAWCSVNLPGGQFTKSGPYPPLPYPDGFFPFAIAYSVFTHLVADVQKAWLEEFRRVIAPGGLLLATVHGPQAAAWAFPETGRSRLSKLLFAPRTPAFLAPGFFDAGADPVLDGVAPEGYYRGVFQTPEWTRKEWSRYFEVVEIREGGMNGYQDLVVLRRR
ncbi:MAG: class I SAM-dependent methyltransferase [Thermoanaerobaculia bacterium]